MLYDAKWVQNPKYIKEGILKKYVILWSEKYVILGNRLWWTDWLHASKRITNVLFGLCVKKIISDSLSLCLSYAQALRKAQNDMRLECCFWKSYFLGKLLCLLTWAILSNIYVSYMIVRCIISAECLNLI